MTDTPADDASRAHHTVGGIRYLCHTDDHYCPPETTPPPADEDRRPVDSDGACTLDCPPVGDPSPCPCTPGVLDRRQRYADAEETARKAEQEADATATAAAHLANLARERAERAEAALERVRAECDRIDAELYPVADDGMAIAVRRVRAALDTDRS